MIVPITPTQSTKRNEASAVRLALYAHIIEYDECAFWGVNPPSNVDTGCRKVWTKNQRDTVSYYLAEAQEEIEDLLGYFLSPRWVVGTLDEASFEQERLVDNQPLQHGHYLARWGMVIEPGVKATETVVSGTAVNHATDPAVVGPIAVPAGTAVEEIVVYHPDSEITVSPSSVVIAGGNVTIEIPRCRLVKLDRVDNDKQGLDYNDLNNFESTVDVVRVYNDPSTNAVIVGPNRSSCLCAGAGCGNCEQTACIRIEDQRTGHITARPGSYSNGSWSSSGNCNCCSGSQVRMYYRAGFQQLSRQGREMIVRLTHSKMPEPPCACDVTNNLWVRDRNIPDALTRERLNCPFGLNDGAWIAYRFAMAKRLQRGLLDY